ncbi:Hypothetical predicted protein [Pelobates cultripes]|uniref:Uncharacterized protein n=1 Tax=Pelobates cultripes TaxID=61616 RepID=A0AAD1RW18_PELCU|nr:Hypothetical predicted protein [Pelobates cultripes]
MDARRASSPRHCAASAREGSDPSPRRTTQTSTHSPAREEKRWANHRGLYSHHPRCLQKNGGWRRSPFSPLTEQRSWDFVKQGLWYRLKPLIWTLNTTAARMTVRLAPQEGNIYV